MILGWPNGTLVLPQLLWIVRLWIGQPPVGIVHGTSQVRTPYPCGIVHIMKRFDDDTFE